MTDLNWFGWIVLALWVLSTLVSVAQVGKPRSTLEPATAVVIVVINGLLILGLLTVGVTA